MLVHICCSVDSHYFLQKLQKDYPKAKLIGFFYDPNIHPYSEYYLRLLDVKRSCNMLGIELIEGEYDFRAWLEAVRGLEDEPEKGKRCSVCFDRRFEVSAKRAKELGCDAFTSTLLTSPKKSIEQLKASGDALAKQEGIEFLTLDYRTNSGTQEQNRLAKEDKLYRQNYCGCMFALSKQRQAQQIVASELFSPINRQILPNSIEDKIRLYQKRVELEEKGIEYEIVKSRFLNWRLLYGLVRQKGKSIPSYILAFSKLKRKFSRGKVEKEINGVFYFNRDEIKFITLEYFNKLANRDYKSIKELYFNPLPFEEEIKIRDKLTLLSYDLSAIIVVEKEPIGKYEILLNSTIYEDIKENLIILSK
ncbi:MAG: epoxyqueuosine reductase QueH [Epsilonproteobacteria bacterium]|nr:epoxyqueuosine reductase QueH [Campylobacterota bacterium]